MSAVQAFWKHCGKRRIARNKQFLLFPQCFLPIWRTFCHFHQIWICRLQPLKFVIWERVDDQGVESAGQDQTRSTCNCRLNKSLVRTSVNHFPNDKFWTRPNREGLQTTILNFPENGRKFFKHVENTVGKGEISPFLIVFSEDLYCKHVKTRAGLGKG